ncbi:MULTISPECIES: hypothetical protein [Flavobacterium]|uniref:Uncharacterized protein n=1 Tax=Flavobacterium algoritolerans TaxID=3041254 RepID=A0ABT6VAT5_9FLAO|nr:hypothetical protein [Flavobacterium algoritolerans]MDI5895350.1 hypothetical protein [Flavobacterium algoritolerans]
MNSFYIFNLEYKKQLKKEGKTTATVIFCADITIDISQLQIEIKNFYSKEYQTDKTIFIGGDYIVDFEKQIIENRPAIFKYVPKIDNKSFYDDLHLLSFNHIGELKEVSSVNLKGFNYLESFSKNYLTFGTQNFFLNHEGLVESIGDSQHYVFPSGKHSQRFLRTANVLLYSCEITFLALGLLKQFNKKNYRYIYCDTSSINSVALAMINLANRFKPLGEQMNYPINSFKSYEGLYDEKFQLKPNSFILISASTSGSIIEYIIKKQAAISKEDVIVLFYLENKNPSQITKEQVICNLTKSDNNPKGVDPYKTYTDDNCDLCNNGSFPIEVSGDVFLLEKPKINSIVINGADIAIQTSAKFMNQFISDKKEESVLKVNYKDTDQSSSRKYEIYIDYSKIIQNLDRFKDHQTKLDAYIDQFVPSNLKYIVFLNDHSSELLAHYILNRIEPNYKKENIPQMFSQNNFSSVAEKPSGSILIVSSCISNGKNLLYLNRALRDNNLRIIFFIGINRISNTESNKFLKTNLKYGDYGPENSTFIEVETIACSNLSESNSWQKELDFIQKYLKEVDNPEVFEFLREREKSLVNCESQEIKGLSKHLFLPNLFSDNKEILGIRRNSAFFDRVDYAEHASQSDVFFSIAYVVNRLRNSGNLSHILKQSSFIRNLLSPSNFNRFNDGVIQASFLRCARNEEMNYAIDSALSKEMKDILITIFKYRTEAQGEALLEFLYGMAIGKFTLKKDDLKAVLAELNNETNEIIIFYKTIIENNTKIKEE